MSGHNKWANIKHRKGAQDKKRSALFNKVIRELTVAAREGGGDPDLNPRLRSALDKAREANMPKDTWEKAIKRGTGELEGVEYVEIMYEGYGPAGVAMIITTVSDNKNRTAQEVRHVFSKYNGNMAESGAVSWNFEKKGTMIVEKSEISDAEEFMMTAIECGADDIDDSSDPVEVRTAPEDMMSVADAIRAAGFTPRDVEFAYIPKTTVAIEGRDAEKVLNLISKFEDLDDVQNVYANFDIDDDEMERIMETL
ncbi:MAG TPA: YebC/PmpR family DNA-binding transcriptional regulator [Thermotogota bacterium]|nr:YebC/PmpR family DNA-binding transcriptional regulator [Thermotogota bacterium]HPJ88424.1 YebC/PmpR family DNA-binding transcriptional regulator [Thermotogota bacterium]HPR95409.1 YebC/PmpR family DNA-binding transcriptional regulator [Thermotogota bacterium]